MKKNSPLIIFLILSLFCLTAVAAEPFDQSSAVGVILSAMAPAGATLQENAWKWLSVFMLLQFVLTNVKVLTTGGDIDSIWPKFMASIFWFGICFFIMQNGPSFISNVGNQFFGLVGNGMPDPSTIIKNTTYLSTMLAALAAGAGFFSATTGQLILYILMIVAGVGIFFAIKILMIQLELALVVMLSPLSFSMLGLNALKDQGIAPLKSLISLAYRIILTSIILTAFTQVESVVMTRIDEISVANITADGVSKVVDTLLGGIAAYLLLAVLLYKSDSIASGLASGGTSMGTADIASSVAAGVAGGMAAQASAGAAAASAGNGASSVSDMVKGLRSQAASVTNASGNGTGGSSAARSAGNGSFSLGDAPKGPAKSPNHSIQDLHQMAKDKGLPPVGGAKPSSSGTNPTTPSSSNASPSASSRNNTPGSNAASSARDMGLGSAPSGMRYTNTEPAPNENSQSSPLGNANNASISGESGTSGSGLEKQLEALVDQLSKQGQSKPSAADRLGSLNSHIERQTAATHVSINTHSND